MITANASQRTWRNGGCDVLLAVDAYMPWSGGSRIYYDNLYRRLSDKYQLRVTVETSHCEGDETFDIKFASKMLTIKRQGTRLPDWKVSRAPVLVRKMLRIAQATSDIDPAAIHCGDLFPQDFAGMLIRKLRGVPLLVFVHGDEINQTEGRRLQPRLRNAIYRAADSVVVANRFAHEKVTEILRSGDHVTMITPGVDMRVFHPGRRPAWISDRFRVGDDPLLVTVGRLVKKKGHETVLRGLPALLRKYPQVKYLIVGEGPERRRLEAITSDLGLAGSVRFVGNVPNYNIGDFYMAADVFCLVNQEDASGDIESFGMVFVEAGACGKPVIGGRSGGTSQSILDGETGMLCDPENVPQFCDLVDMLLSRPELRRRMGEIGRERAQREFSWESRAAQLFEVHKSITRATRRRTGGTDLCFQR